MPTDIRVKICGLRDADAIAAATDAGAAYVGFVFFPKSPRHVSLEQASMLAAEVPLGVAKVALVVNATDAELDAICGQVPLDMLQLHGSETPERVSEVRARYGLPVMKAVGVADESDLAQLDVYGQVADQLLVDSKPPEDADRPGGNGATFDWNLIGHRRWPVPWMLAGGLTVDNVADALVVSGARQLDLSSAVERTPGVKDPAKIREFMDAVQKA
ncbi:phosphoribosylanthranilate isomerase [Cognatiyoonia sp. IB215446]|uniref:phosphoribosylanthranilate isomerase n=1 Tax=Cognatiyoonia sp. IB215446 TaxID=3097355 RepID=UPI002A0BC14B|nr:phosphoribosylanthranilate isomerase [Cognatiyoonia sp. IB215446]MDX8347990.1 phosphoribosylanthranilate isomerase [Cognatiyoonia sp. IB215446]